MGAKPGTGDSIEALSKVFSGAALILLGFLGGGLLTLSTQVILARFLEPELFGVFSQGMAVLYTLVMLSMLGLNAGLSRYISYNKRDIEKVEKAVGSSLALTLPISIAVFATLYLTAGSVSTFLLNDYRTAQILRIFSLTGPAMVVNSIFISGFRGQQQSKERVLLLDFFIPLMQVLGVSAAILLGYSVAGATAGYASAFLFASLAIGWWYSRHHELEIDLSVLKELVSFSWPIMVSGLAVQVFLWAPPLLVGALASSHQVGILNAALPLAASTKMFLSAAAFLFMPVTAEVFSRENVEQLREIHSTTTRWIINASLPVLAFFIFFGDSTVKWLFGNSYTSAGLILSIMAAGYIFNTFTGPVGELLISVGRTKREMFANTIRLALLLSLSLLLIPRYGAIGAAAAYAAGMAVGNSLRLWFCRRYLGLFYNQKFLKPAIAVLPGLVGFSFLNSYGFPAACTIFVSLYFISLSIMKPLERSDRKFLEDFQEKTGLKHPAITHLIKLLSRD